MKSCSIAVNMVAGLALAACAGAQSGDEHESQPVQDDDTRAGELSVSSVPPVAGDASADMKAGGGSALGPGLQRLADLARRDLGARLGVEPDDIEVLAAEYVTWRNSSVGCPRPGFQYMDVLTNGSRIKLRANKKVFHYHSGRKQPPFLCEKPSGIEPLPYGDGEI